LNFTTIIRRLQFHFPQDAQPLCHAAVLPVLFCWSSGLLFCLSSDLPVCRSSGLPVFWSAGLVLTAAVPPVCLPAAPKAGQGDLAVGDRARTGLEKSAGLLRPEPRIVVVLSGGAVVR